jgi:hypothetical protein
MTTRGKDLTLKSTVSDRSRSYVDAEWIVPGTGDARVLVVAPDGSGDASDRRAGLALLGVALRAVDAVADVPGELVEVTGAGFVAGAVRRLLGSTSTAMSGHRPLAVVDTTGDPEQLVAATRRLDDLGVLALAGESAGRSVDLDLYPDVHLRGLCIVGVSPARVDAVPETIPDAALAYLAAQPPVAVRAGEPLPRASWYRID